MNKEFCNYTQALALKELGFDEPCFGYYYHENNFTKCRPQIYYSNTFTICDCHEEIPLDSCKAPLYQQAFRWFREKHGVYTEIFVDDDKTFGFMITHFTSEGRVDSPVKYGHITYEEAESACLDKLIQIVTGTTESNHTK